MSAPTLYILIPLLFGITLLILRKKMKLVQGLGIGFSFVWGLIGFTLPIGEVIPTGGPAIKIASSTLILGRTLSILDSDRALIGIIFTFCAVWYLAAILKKIENHFIPIGIMISGLLIGTIAIEPFLYSALILAIIALMFIVILSEKGTQIRAGLVRYLVIQMLGVPFILLTGWILTVAGVNPSDELILLQAILFILMGFMFWLGIFPFHSWIPMIASEGNIIASGFLFSLVPSAIFIMLLDYVNSYSWLRESALFFLSLYICGIIMLITGGIGAAFQTDSKKLFGYSVIIETGFVLMAIGLDSRIGYEYVVMSLFPRLLAFLLISLTISQTDQKGTEGGRIKNEGLLHRKPWTAIGLFVGLMCIAGIPLSAIFPLRLQLVTLALQIHPESIMGVGIAIFGLLIGSTRLAMNMCKPSTEDRVTESKLYISVVMGSIALLFLVGLFPTFFLSNFSNILTGFPFLK